MNQLKDKDEGLGLPLDFHDDFEEADLGEEVIKEPFDPTKIRVATSSPTVDLLVARMRNGEIDLAPAFQRRGDIWTEPVQSRLIESMLIKIPLPAFYVDATDEDLWVVVDGLQRLNTLKRFIIDQDLKLTGLEFLTAIKGKCYDDLSRNFQRRIQETQVTLYQIERGTPTEVKYNIFKRVNTAGLPLSSQEIRHALNQGNATKLLKELALSPDFIEATGGRIRPTRMEDHEFVLRFLAFALLPYEEYDPKSSKGFDNFLLNTMREINHLSDSGCRELSDRFQRVMVASTRLSKSNLFRKYNKTRMMPINKALFEVWTVCLDRLTDNEIDKLVARQENLNTLYQILFEDPSFNSAISLATSNSINIRTRFNCIKKLIDEVLQ